MKQKMCSAWNQLFNFSRVLHLPWQVVAWLINIKMPNISNIQKIIHPSKAIRDHLK